MVTFESSKERTYFCQGCTFSWANLQGRCGNPERKECFPTTTCSDDKRHCQATTWTYGKTNRACHRHSVYQWQIISWFCGQDDSLQWNCEFGGTEEGEIYTAATLRAALGDILHLYNKADIYIMRIHADNELKSIFRELDKTWDVNFNFSLPQEDVPDIEHENRVLQERFRVGLYRLP